MGREYKVREEEAEEPCEVRNKCWFYEALKLRKIKGLPSQCITEELADCEGGGHCSLKENISSKLEREHITI